MIGALPYKTKQFFFVLIKLSIVFGAFYFIYFKLTNNHQMDFLVFIDFVSKNADFSIKSLFFVSFLTILNWFFEISKWHHLVSLIKKISFLEAMEQSLGALTASLFTPNRIGEYGAKAIYYERPFRKRILLLNLMGNMAQMLATVLFGIIGLIIFIKQYNMSISYYKLSQLLIIIMLIIAFLSLGHKQNKIRIKGFSIGKVLNYIKSIPFKFHLNNMAFSFLRYIVFSFQFYYLLKVFGSPINYLDAMTAITSMYLMASIIPTIFIFDVVVKGSVAVFLFSFLNINDLLVLCVITTMWLLNFVIPSVFGSYYVMNFNWSTEEE